MSSIVDRAGRRYGRLVVIELASTAPVRWLCQCDCGKQAVIRAGNLKPDGGTRSCGCLYLKHGQARRGKKTGAYNSWISMFTRCYNPSCEEYHNYGGRGITICERWWKFENFYADMGDRPEGMEIDRFPDNDGNYEPGNCRWATKPQQMRNTRVNRLIEFRGRAQCLQDWAKETGLSAPVLHYRLRVGWSVEQALTTPIGGR
jgi:hypothetical protein